MSKEWDNQKAELIRKKYAYRRAVMKGKVKLSVPAAARLIGPDCAYHLYSTFDGKEAKEENDPTTTSENSTPP